MPHPPLSVVELGQMSYEKAWELQENLVFTRAKGQWNKDSLLLVEHPHVFTLGRRADSSHLLDPRDERGDLIPTYDVNRGGDITYHGPGQVVGYPILHLGGVGGDVIVYLRTIEAVLIKVCKQFGLKAERRKAYTGVWVEGKKIASIGVGVQRGYTLHGFALNVNTNLGFFERIVPCGIQDVEMASIESLTGRPITLESVKRLVIREMGEAFQRVPETGRLADIPLLQKP